MAEIPLQRQEHWQVARRGRGTQRHAMTSCRRTQTTPRWDAAQRQLQPKVVHCAAASDIDPASCGACAVTCRPAICVQLVCCDKVHLLAGPQAHVKHSGTAAAAAAGAPTAHVGSASAQWAAPGKLSKHSEG
jgi:hypothetical protein